MNIFEKIKSMNLDEMAEFWYEYTCVCEDSPCAGCKRKAFCDCENVEDFKRVFATQWKN